MALAKQQPLYSTPTDYEDDFAAWAFEQTELLRQKRLAEMDLPNVVEELESIGKEQRHALESSYRLVISHLLKWQFQPDIRSRSWAKTIDGERANIERREDDNPSLAADAKRIVDRIYRYAVREAARDTDLPRSTFPAECPYSVEQLRNADWMPE